MEGVLMKKVMLVILDGFGYREEKNGNAILNANMSNYNSLWESYPHTTLHASGEYVGLEPGVFGNSETGHMTIGAGRKIKSNREIINDFFSGLNTNEAFEEFINKVIDNNKPLHIMGLLSEGNVHSSVEHWTKLINCLKGRVSNKIYFHIITDGRDTDPKSASMYIEKLQEKISDMRNAKIASICGRYYAMDRDKNWSRTKIYYDLITKGLAISCKDIKLSIEKSYESNITDEYLKPLIVDKEGIINNGDNVFWMNYREDRAVQILNAITNKEFSDFAKKDISECSVYSFFPFDKPINTISFVDYDKVNDPIGVYFSKLGLTQARIAETEKYAHVTYFFDGQYDGKLDKCDKFLLSSPKVATYDLQPEMSAVEVTKKAMACLEKDYDFIVVNYANPDMVGHTGNFEATVKACSAVDICLGKLVETAFDNFYKVIIMSDHGNADTMVDENGNICTTHTLSKVPFIITDNSLELKNSGSIAMVAPTILDYMDIARPTDMNMTDSLIK